MSENENTEATETETPEVEAHSSVLDLQDQAETPAASGACVSLVSVVNQE